MERALRLLTPLVSYAWGSRTALAELMGRPAPAQEPEAELWIGAHPAAPARVVTAAGTLPFADWIASDPERTLGSAVARRFGRELPFLLKVLAVETPLSLQCHPDAAQAHLGFEREERLGLAAGDPRRVYRDPRGKPELVCSLARFETLAGFREACDVQERLAVLAVAGLEPALAPLRARPDAVGLRDSLAALLRLAPGDRHEIVSSAARAAAARAGGDPSLAWVEALARLWPGDPAALAPVYLRHFVLRAGEALFLAPGDLHCHLGGVAVEVMASSDNVLRGGLTAKPVDVEELLRALRVESSSARPLRGDPVSRAERAFPATATEFHLSLLRLAPGDAAPVGGRGGIEVLLCTEGALCVAPAAGGDGLALPRGAAAVLPAAAPAQHLTGRGTAFRASVPVDS